MSYELIPREKAIEAIRDLLLEPDSIQYIFSSDAIGVVQNVPSVPAVPLDKLCEWLQDNAAMTHGTLISAAGWKYELIQWMKELDQNDAE